MRTGVPKLNMADAEKDKYIRELEAEVSDSFAILRAAGLETSAIAPIKPLSYSVALFIAQQLKNKGN